MSESGRAEEFLLEEYRQLWAYYTHTLVERKNLFDWYAKAVTIPAAIIGYLASSAPGSPRLADSIVSPLLVVVGLVGFAFFGTYAKESSNAAAYIDALAVLREEMGRREPTLSAALVIDRIRAEAGGSKRLGKVTAWRGAGLVIVNSAILAAAAAVHFAPSTWLPVALISATAAVLAHVSLYDYLYHGFAPSPFLGQLRVRLGNLRERLKPPGSA